jgi:uncharacterized membrane protein
MMNKRIYSIDILRGIAMLLMALDHSRGFFYTSKYDPSKLDFVSVWLFFTRWITHFCAPIFIFLAGMSIYLTLKNKKSPKTESIFLIKRGIWLVFLEVTVLTFFWHTHFDIIQLQIIWVIGISFLIMALLIYLPWGINLILAIVIIISHNLLDHLNIENLSKGLKIIMIFLHNPGEFLITNSMTIDVLYNILPWTGIMILGYCMALVYNFSPKKRKSIFIGSGIAMILLFIVLRSFNIYGEPNEWPIHSNSFLYSFILFLNVTKYPASLQYVLITLGPTLIFLALLDSASEFRFKNIRLFGQTALFFYLVHIPFIRVLSKIYEINYDHRPPILLFYLIYAIIILVMFFLCRIYRDFKIAKKSDPHYWWLVYL